MLIEINYKIEYEYSEPVFLESNEIKIIPRSDLTQKLYDYRIEIMPTPSNKTFFIDEENNYGVKTWFNGQTDKLEIQLNCTVETLRHNPYDYIIDFSATTLPYANITEITPVKLFSDEIRECANNDLLKFLFLLAEKIRSEFKYIIRENGAPKSAEETLKDKTGACRDYAVLFIEACKLQGIQARFVSGYFLDEEMQHSSHLHAWAEVYIPGAGWRGYDPVNGLAVADRHIAIASSHHPVKVLPVTGKYRSNTAKSRMTYSIKLKKV